MRKRRFIRVMTVSIGFCICLSVLILIDRALFWRAQRDELSNWAQKADVTGPRNAGGTTVLFIGDSIVESFPLRLALPQECRVINKGVSKNCMNQICERYRSLAQSTHDTVVIEGGINDILNCILRRGDEISTSKEILKGYENILRTANQNGKKAIVIEILPVTGRFLLPYWRSIPLPTAFEVERSNNLIRKTNYALRALCWEQKVQFVETRRLFSGDTGEMKREFVAADGFHLNITGYRSLATAILPYVSRL